MSQRITKAQRWLDLVVFLLRHRFPVSVEQIMEAVPGYADDWRSEDATRRASVRRKFERDKDELRELGIPIETVRYRIEGLETDGYRLKEGALHLPRLRIERGSGPESDRDRARFGPARFPEVEASPAVWSALARAAQRAAHLPDSPLAPYARSALRKLGFDLPEVAEAAAEPWVHHLELPTPDVADALTVLTPALLDRKEVRFSYYSIRRDERAARCAWPFGLLYQGGHWYLIGHDPEADALRTFRVSRMREVESNPRSPKTPDYEIPDGFELRDHVGREAWRLGEDGADEIDAEVLFLPPTAWWAESRGLGEYLREDEETGGQVRRFRVRQLDTFLRWCLSFRGQARPRAPERVVDAFAALVADVRTLYEDGEGERGPAKGRSGPGGGSSTDPAGDEEVADGE